MHWHKGSRGKGSKKHQHRTSNHQPVHCAVPRRGQSLPPSAVPEEGSSFSSSLVLAVWRIHRWRRWLQRGHSSLLERIRFYCAFAKERSLYWIMDEVSLGCIQRQPGSIVVHCWYWGPNRWEKKWERSGHHSFPGLGHQRPQNEASCCSASALLCRIPRLGSFLC